MSHENASSLRAAVLSSVPALGFALAFALAPPVAAQQKPPARPLLYTATQDGNANLHLLTPTASTRLTDAPEADNCAAWSPDGARIAFQSQRDGNYEVSVMNADGSEHAYRGGRQRKPLPPRRGHRGGAATDPR